MESLRTGVTPPALTLRRGVHPSEVLGVAVTYRELLRVEWLGATNIDATHTFQGENGLTYLTQTGLDLRDAGIVAAGVIDPESGRPIWASEDILGWPNRAELWAELRILARKIRELSEVGPDALKSGGAQDDPGGAT